MSQTNHTERVRNRAVCALIIVLWFAFPAWSDADSGRKAAAKKLAAEIEQAQLHRVYVSDFLDASGVRSEKGCYFASSFSTMLSKDRHNFEVLNRIQAQKQLDALHISSQDLLKPDLLSKAAQALGADAVLLGTAAITPTDANLSLSLRDSSGKEVHSMNYHEELQPAFDSSFPAIEDPGNHFYYFEGLDGVSPPKCTYCPDPEYSDEARRKKIQGTVLMSVVVDEKGIIKDARVVKSADDSLGKQSLAILTRWRLEPCHDPEGKAVAVRVMIETMFKLLR